MNKDFYINKLYEAYLDEFVKDEKYEAISKKLSNKYEELTKKLNKEEIKDVDEFELYLTNLLEIETKSAFEGGFDVAITLLLEKRDKLD